MRVLLIIFLLFIMRKQFWNWLI